MYGTRATVLPDNRSTMSLFSRIANLVVTVETMAFQVQWDLFHNAANRMNFECRLIGQNRMCHRLQIHLRNLKAACSAHIRSHYDEDSWIR